MICGGENGTVGCHVAGFSEDVAFARHFVATHPIGVLVVLAMPVTKLSKMAGNPASYPVCSRYNELLWIAIDLWKTRAGSSSHSRDNWIFQNCISEYL